MSAAVEDAAVGTARRQALSVGVATGAYGVSFGALAVAAGFDVLQTQALSLLLFTGGSQFAVVSVMGAGGSPATAVATSTMLGIRNGLYALETSRVLDVRGWRRLAAAHVTIDESTAVGLAQPTTRSRRVGFWWTGLAVLAFWNLATLAGSALGNALGDPRTWGLDAAAAAAFVGLIWPRLRSAPTVVTAAVAALVALVSYASVPAGVPVLLAALAALVVGLTGAGRTEPEPGHLDGEDPTP
ncbi:AzlC family ABC transporter permease [Janibacter sp. UYMM211]|uniref:AzlC family ABC transporter permease n=1 Tax=Janibacter sp. UYMM211 TaxID=3156342 RepID=UPI0033988D97